MKPFWISLGNFLSARKAFWTISNGALIQAVNKAETNIGKGFQYQSILKIRGLVGSPSVKYQNEASLTPMSNIPLVAIKPEFLYILALKSGSYFIDWK